jgi:hypothetical protein
MNPNQPTTKSPLSEKKEMAIAARWEELLPWCLLDARKTTDPAETLHMFKTRHRERCIELFTNHISWKAIRTYQWNGLVGTMDDPRNEEWIFKKLLSEAIERRRSRMGRVKGQRNANRTRSRTQHKAHWERTENDITRGF